MWLWSEDLTTFCNILNAKKECEPTNQRWKINLPSVKSNLIFFNIFFILFEFVSVEIHSKTYRCWQQHTKLFFNFSIAISCSSYYIVRTLNRLSINERSNKNYTWLGAWCSQVFCRCCCSFHSIHSTKRSKKLLHYWR